MGRGGKAQEREVRRPAEVFAARVREARTRRDWTQQTLCERLEELGFPMDRASLARLETGKRGVSLEEFTAIAAALGTAPANMLIPLDDECDVEISSEHVLPPADARRWVRGDQPLAATDEKTYFDVEVPTFEQRSRRRFPEATALRQDLAALADSPDTTLTNAFFEMVKQRLHVLQLHGTSAARDRQLRKQEASTNSAWRPIADPKVARRKP